MAFPSLRVKLDREVYFVTTQELEDRWPDKTPKEREHAICAEHHSVFLMQIGCKLKSGQKHDGRAPDYDDWALNGDILMWNPVLERSFEISSMGIRVDEESMAHQLKLAGCEERAELPFHKMLLNGEPWRFFGVPGKNGGLAHHRGADHRKSKSGKDELKKTVPGMTSRYCFYLKDGFIYVSGEASRSDGKPSSRRAMPRNG